MKIAFLAPANSIHTVKWVNAMAARGHQVHLYTLSCHADADGAISPEVKQFTLPARGKEGYYLCAGRCKKLLRAGVYDLVNAHYASGYGTLARLAVAKPLLLSVWGSDVFDFPYSNALNHNLILKNLGYADKIASTSHTMAAQVKKLCPAADVAVTPFGVDTGAFSPAEGKRADGPFRIGVVKSLEPVYGIEYLIRACGILREEGRTDFELRVYGDGSRRDALAALTRELGVGDIVTFFGKIPHGELPDALRKLDAAAFPSLRESFGVAAVEAMACGLPVVVSDAPGLAEVVAEAGIVVPKEDVVALTAALASLIDDPALHARLGGAGRRRVLESYDWDRCVEQMENVYQSVAEARKVV